MAKTVLGVIGGSGVYDIAGLEHARWDRVVSPWGEPSDQLLFGRLAGVDMIFLPRHGRGHIHSPTTINYRANIDALKRAGATDVISVSACGSFRENLAPELSPSSTSSSTAPMPARRVSSARALSPMSRWRIRSVPSWRARWWKPARRKTSPIAKAEPISRWKVRNSHRWPNSNLYRSWGCDVIGMTAMPEAKLAREAELPYALVAMVTDYDCWHPDHDHVTVDQVIKILTANADNARRLITRAAPKLGPERTPSPLGIEHVLDTAVITAYEKRDPALFDKLDAVAGRILRKKY